MGLSKPGRRVLALAVATVLGTMVAPLAAQEAANAAAPQTDDEERATTLAGLTVTAQKREEALQDVPISITALPEQLLQDTGVRDIKDLQVLVPGLTVTSTQSEAQTTARIRGIGTVGDNAGLESSVGIVIDGVYRPRNGVGFGDLGEIERIEVLKGPQGTVFGKNTSAGVINVITRRPDYNTRVEGELTVGNYGALGVSGSLNSPLGENAAFRIYAAKRKRDGFMDVRTGAGPRQRDRRLRPELPLVARPVADRADRLRWTSTSSRDFTSREENCCTARDRRCAAPTADIIDALSPDCGRGAGGRSVRPRGLEQPQHRAGHQGQGHLGRSQLDLAVARRCDPDLDHRAARLGRDQRPGLRLQQRRHPVPQCRCRRVADRVQDLQPGVPPDRRDRQHRLDGGRVLFRRGPGPQRNLPHRRGLRAVPVHRAAVAGQPRAGPASPTRRASSPRRPGAPSGTVFAGFGANDRYDQNAKSLALFTNNTWHATDALDLTLGLRYTREDKELDSVYTNPNGSPGCVVDAGQPVGRRSGALPPP